MDQSSSNQREEASLACERLNWEQLQSLRQTPHLILYLWNF